MTTIEIMDANWSGYSILLSVNLHDGERCTALTVRAAFEYDRYNRQYDVTLSCERVLGVEVAGVDQVLANHFAGAELEAQVLGHERELEDYAREVFGRYDARAAV